MPKQPSQTPHLSPFNLCRGVSCAPRCQCIDGAELSARPDMARPAALTLSLLIISATHAQDYYKTPRIGPSKLASCYTNDGQPQRCIPEFENAAYMVQMDVTNTCADSGETMYCIQTSAGTSTR
ncbi:unnamed protein product [Plutella xylostella]|uniref:(diamondback moth) hypothetical protein n=1 Tax=Plutella xylostella TaxID=51655 RepID=A0A8S4G753_PLUXY|nr:unnamed protein product [Plutella xylostella]